MTNIPKIKVDLTKVQNEPFPKDYLEKIMRDAYCKKCGKLKGDGEYGCMCEYSDVYPEIFNEENEQHCVNASHENMKRVRKVMSKDKGTITKGDIDNMMSTSYDNETIDYEAMNEDEQKAYNLRVHRIANEREKIKFPVENKWHDAKKELPDKPSRYYVGNKLISIPYIVYNGDFTTVGFFVKNKDESYFRYFHSSHKIKPEVILWTDLPEVPEGY